MKNCLERLKPYIRKNLEANKDVYPLSVESITTTLKECYSINEIPFGQMVTLTSYTDGKVINEITGLYNMFD